MDVTNLTSVDIEETLEYYRKGEKCTAFPLKDCRIDPDIDDMIELGSISGSYYFYSQIYYDLIKIREGLESQLASKKDSITHELLVRKSSVYLEAQMKLTQSQSRVTDKVLEAIINVDKEVVTLCKKLHDLSEYREKILEVKSKEDRFRAIMKALGLKHESLIEMSRRKKAQLNLG